MAALTHFQIHEINASNYSNARWWQGLNCFQLVGYFGVEFFVKLIST